MLDPLGSRLLVRKLDLNQPMTQSGLHIPVTGFDEQTVGEVVKAGPGAHLTASDREKIRCKPGDCVLFTAVDADPSDTPGLYVVPCQKVMAVVAYSK